MLISDFQPFLFFAVGIVVSAIAAQIILLIKQSKKKRISAEGSREERETCLETVLSALNCNYTAQRKEEATRYTFSYQQGNFYLHADASSPIATLWFSIFFVAEPQDLDLVRTVCNAVNASRIIHKVFYQLDEKMDRVLVHGIASLNVVNNVPLMQQCIASLLDGFFAIRRDFYDDFRKLKESADDKRDPEGQELTSRHEIFLLREHELRHQKTSLGFRPNETQRATLGQLLETVYGWKDMHAKRLRIITQGVNELTEEIDIKNFEPLQPLIISENSGSPQFTGNELTLILYCSHASGPQTQEKRTIIIIVRPYGEAGSTLYVQATLILLPTAAATSTPRVGEASRTRVNSLVIPYDAKPVDKQLAEVDYMWKEAQDKIKEGKRHELTPEQAAICRCNSTSLSFDLYWGNHYFRLKSYYQALLHLENAWRRINEEYATLQPEGRQSFYDLCYQIGYCYDELGIPAKAYYYLDATLPLQRIKYTMEYINCLTQAKDFRAYPFVIHMLDSLHSGSPGEQKQMPRTMQSFVNFLRRRKAYLELDRGDIDTAEGTLRKMLNEPENADFALTELADIQQLRHQQKAKNQPSPPSDAPHTGLSQ